MDSAHTGWVMWDEIKAALVDSSTTLGLRASFVENLSAELIGVLLGVCVSFVAAFSLDKIGNSRQFKPLRHRTAAQLANLHDMLRAELLKPFSQGGGNGRAVTVAIEELDEILDNFDFGLTPQQRLAVDAYRMKLRALETSASAALRRGPQITDGFDSATRALRPALKRLHSGRLEPYWKEVLSSGLLLDQPAPATTSKPTPFSVLGGRSNASSEAAER